MLLDGMTYQEVADHFGVTKQCIHQKFRGIVSRDTTANSKSIKNSVHPNLASWIVENGLSVMQFAKRAWITPQHMYLILLGKSNCAKSVIDKILQETGMTYEVAFSKEACHEQEI